MPSRLAVVERNAATALWRAVTVRGRRSRQERVSRVRSKPVSTRAERRQVVVRGKTEAQTRSKRESVVRESVAELRGRGLQPKRRAVARERG